VHIIEIRKNVVGRRRIGGSVDSLTEFLRSRSDNIAANWTGESVKRGLLLAWSKFSFLLNAPIFGCFVYR